MTKIIPYNPLIKPFARSMRNKPTIDYSLSELDIRTLRLTNDQVFNNIDYVISTIILAIKTRPLEPRSGGRGSECAARSWGCYAQRRERAASAQHEAGVVGASNKQTGNPFTSPDTR